jgi:flagellar biogenesis protein FliO
MIKQALSQFQHIDVTILGMFIFFIAFFLIVIWTFSRFQKDEYAFAETLPMDSIKDTRKEN